MANNNAGVGMTGLAGAGAAAVAAAALAAGTTGVDKMVSVLVQLTCRAHLSQVTKDQQHRKFVSAGRVQEFFVRLFSSYTWSADSLLHP